MDFVDIRYINGNGNSITAAIAIGDRDGDRIGRLRFIVEGCAGLYLP